MPRKAQTPTSPPKARSISICILAGGVSTRMGRPKERLESNGLTLLQHIRATAHSTGWPLRVLKKDLVERCGPVGGIYTGLKTSEVEAELFLACDMPFVSRELMLKLSSFLGTRSKAVFTAVGRTVGFPFLIRTTALDLVKAQIASNEFSLQALAQKLSAKLVHLSKARSKEVFNINTPEEWKVASQLLETTPQRAVQARAQPRERKVINNR
jgi:molybdenum cofactor guanylyltransferase